jgi:hypothetical protein
MECGRASYRRGIEKAAALLPHSRACGKGGLVADVVFQVDVAWPACWDFEEGPPGRRRYDGAAGFQSSTLLIHPPPTISSPS